MVSFSHVHHGLFVPLIRYENVQEIGDNSTVYLAAAGWESRRVILHSWALSVGSGESLDSEQ